MITDNAEKIVDHSVRLFDGLDEFALAVGHYRISLLDVVTWTITALLLYFAARFAFYLLKKAVRRAGRLDSTQQLLVEKIAGLAIFALAVLIGVDLVGFDLSTLAVFSGALGLAVGFGLQKTFGNLIAGLILLMDRSVKPGDVIVVADTFGTINRIGTRAVSVITRDGKEHLIPNELLMTEAVENWSYSSPNVRVHIPVGVAYSSDLERVEEILHECTKGVERILKSPKPAVWIKDFGDNAVIFEVRIWIRDPEHGIANIKSAVLKKIWWAFKEEGIQIPFPQRDLNLKSMPEGFGGKLSK